MIVSKSNVRVFGRICVLWFLIKHTGSNNYKWLNKIKALINDDFPNVPNVKLESMGINGDINEMIQLLDKA